MIDQILLRDTLQKINASLNRRFEKNADLYISRQDEYELKKHICRQEYGAVADMMKGRDISPEIVIKVFVRNAGIISIDNRSAFEKHMKPILESIQYKMVEYIMEDVLNNTIFMEKDLKYLLFRYYIGGVTAAKRNQYWQSEDYDFDEQEWKILFYTILHQDQNISLQSKLEFIYDALKKHPVILKDTKLFLALKNSLANTDKVKFFQQLCKEMESPTLDDPLYKHMLLEAYVSYGEKAFEDAVSKIKEGSHRKFKEYVKVIAELLRKEEDPELSVNMFDTVLRIYQSPQIKPHIKKRIDHKVWKTAKKNLVLYEVRKAKIDPLLADLEQSEDKSYSTFEEVLKDIQKGEREKNIAYIWVNMGKKSLKQSLVESFQNTPQEYAEKMKEIYYWLFLHNEERSTNHFCEICKIMAFAIVCYGKIEGMAKLADELLLKHVLEKNVQGKSIQTYLANYHFSEYQNQYMD